MRQFLAACAALALIPAAGSLQAAAISAGRVAAGYETPNAPAVRSVSVVPASGKAEIVIGVDASVDVDDFALESPHRVVVDLKGAVLGMSPRYDRQARGGVTNVRAAQFKPNVVRVVIEMDAPHSYEVTRTGNEVHVAVSGGAANFASWYSDESRKPAAAKSAEAPATPKTEVAAYPKAPPASRAPAPDYSPVSPSADISSNDVDVTDDASEAPPLRMSPASAWRPVINASPSRLIIVSRPQSVNQ